jgi:hypothetical protein
MYLKFRFNILKRFHGLKDNLLKNQVNMRRNIIFIFLFSSLKLNQTFLDRICLIWNTINTIFREN